MGDMSQGHRSQLEGTSTGQICNNLSTKINIVMNYKPLKDGRAHESIPIIDKKMREEVSHLNNAEAEPRWRRE